MRANVNLGAALSRMPINLRFGGMIATINRAIGFGLSNPLWSKTELVSLAVEAQQELYNAIGKGSAAKRRMAR
jgi:hypothetical protein